MARAESVIEVPADAADRWDGATGVRAGKL